MRKGYMYDYPPSPFAKILSIPIIFTLYEPLMFQEVSHSTNPTTFTLYERVKE